MFKGLEKFKKLIESNYEFKRMYYIWDDQILTKDQKTGKLKALPDKAIIKLHQRNGIFLEFTVAEILNKDI